MENYTILHCHTMLSNGVTNIDSVTTYKQYINKAKECGMKAMAISEHGSVFEWIHKKTYMESNNIKYIHAEEFYITKSLDEKTRDNFHCLLIARNYQGVLELNKLSSKAFNREDNSYYYVPRISYDDLKSTSDNIIITTACLGGILSKGDVDLKNDFFRFILKNKHRCFFELQHHQSKDQADYNKLLYNISKQYGINCVMCTDTHALNKEHVEARSILQKAKNIHFEGEDEFDLTFKTYDELVDACKKQNAIPIDSYLEAIENTNKIADMIEPFELDYSYKYPHLWGNDSETIFKEKIRQGIKSRGVDKYPNYQEYIDRINYELKAYEHNQAIDFMLLMEDICSWCKEQDIQIGYGRGSCNGSVIAYLLYITEMDSIKHKLNFDRFMNVERVSLSDIDTDFPPSRIDEVKKYIFDKHGLYCSDIVTFNTIALKGAIRDVGRALNIPLGEVGEICDKVELGEETMRERYPQLFKYVDMVNGCVVSVGNHPCGLIVSPHSINDRLGLFTTSTDTVTISQINMKEIDSLNYVKLDLLKLDTIELIADVCKLANIDMITPDNIDITDVDVWNSMRDDTTQIFQWEGDTGDNYIKKLLSDDNIRKFKAIDENVDRMTLLSIGNSAIRPAGASYREDLANGIVRTSGSNAIDDFLKPTFGYLVFQCQIIEFLHSYCGFTMGEADVVRRCVDENTMITMSDGKRKKIKDIAINDKVLTLNRYGGIQYNNVKKIYNNGTKELLEIETQHNHLIKVTPKHKLLTQNGWKQAEELTTDDYLMTPKNNIGENDNLTPNKRLTCTDMFLIGMLLGDGSVGNKTDLHFTNSDIELVNKFKECVNKRLRNKNVCEFKDYEVKGVNVDCVYSIYIISKNYKDSVWNMLKSNEIIGYSASKHLPSNLMKYPCGDKLYSLLGGLFSTDGGYVKQSKAIEYYTISQELAYDIQFILGKCNIYSYVHKSYVKGYNYYCYKVRINTIDGVNKFRDVVLPFIVGKKKKEFEEIINIKNEDNLTGNSYNYMLPNDCVREIFECSSYNNFSLRSIGIDGGFNLNSTITDIKARRLVQNIYCPNTYKLLNSNVIPLKIKSIKEIGKGNVYDMEIEENHNYIAEGLVTHNCFAKKYGTEECIPIIKDGGYLTKDSTHNIDGFITTMKNKYNMSKEEAEVTIVNFLQVIEDASRYLFSLNHSQPYSYEAYVEGWLRYYYPLEFLTIALNINQDKEEKTKALIRYAKKNGIEIKNPRYGKSKDNYFCDKYSNCIYKGVGSIKFMNGNVANELYDLSKSKFNNFIELLDKIKETSLNSKQLDILIRINYFVEFGDINSLLYITELYNLYRKCSQIKKDKLSENDVDIVRKCCKKETEKLFKEIDNLQLINELYKSSVIPQTTKEVVLSNEIKFLGYTHIIDSSSELYGVESIEINQYGTPFITLYQISNGQSQQYKCEKSYFNSYPCEQGDILNVAFRTNKKKKLIGQDESGKNIWENSDDTETIIKIYAKKF